MRLRLKPFERSLRNKVLNKRDLILIVGEDEAELLKLAVTVTGAVQTEPWRQEIDSFFFFFWSSV